MRPEKLILGAGLVAYLALEMSAIREESTLFENRKDGAPAQAVASLLKATMGSSGVVDGNAVVVINPHDAVERKVYDFTVKASAENPAPSFTYIYGAI